MDGEGWTSPSQSFPIDLTTSSSSSSFFSSFLAVPGSILCMDDATIEIHPQCFIRLSYKFYLWIINVKYNLGLG